VLVGKEDGMSPKNTVPKATSRRPKKTSRRHGYRGYGSGVGKDSSSFGGRVHWGRGFTGVEFPHSGSENLLESGLLTPELKEKTSKR
jgi:hypothetical protein